MTLMNIQTWTLYEKVGQILPVSNFCTCLVNPIVHMVFDRAPGRFAPKPVPPGTIPPGHFAQNLERDCSLQSSETIRSKTNFRVDSPIFIRYRYIHLKTKFGDTVSFLEQ